MSKAKANKWANCTEKEVRGRVAEAKAPIADFPMKYVWHTGPWFDVFDLQIELITRDILRARAEDKLIVYLSCPISSRGGGYSATNVDVAKHIERTLLERWGEAFWILNPAQYQLESKAGTGLIQAHAAHLGIKDLEKLKRVDRPLGGDYMRMWTTVLVSDSAEIPGRKSDPKLPNTGQFFDAFYFIGPRDVQSFFLREGETLTSGIQAYFARKFATDPDFRGAYDESDVEWKDLEEPTVAQVEARTKWVTKRNDFLRYYSLRASANFSLGSHDEWLIFCHLNEKRRRLTKDPPNQVVDGDVGAQLAGFFDGSQIDIASSESAASHGYSW